MPSQHTWNEVCSDLHLINSRYIKGRRQQRSAQDLIDDKGIEESTGRDRNDGGGKYVLVIWPSKGATQISVRLLQFGPLWRFLYSFLRLGHWRKIPLLRIGAGISFLLTHSSDDNLNSIGFLHASNKHEDTSQEQDVGWTGSQSWPNMSKPTLGFKDI